MQRVVRSGRSGAARITCGVIVFSDQRFFSPLAVDRAHSCSFIRRGAHGAPTGDRPYLGLLREWRRRGLPPSTMIGFLFSGVRLRRRVGWDAAAGDGIHTDTVRTAAEMRAVAGRRLVAGGRAVVGLLSA